MNESKILFYSLLRVLHLIDTKKYHKKLTKHFRFSLEPSREVDTCRIACKETYGQVSALSPDKPTGVVVAHDASRTGCPILSWDIANQLRQEYNIIFIVLGEGPILPDIIKIADFTIYCPSNHRHNSAWLSKKLDHYLHDTEISFVLANSIESRGVLDYFSRRGIPSLSLIHEFAATVSTDAFREAFTKADKAIFSTSIVKQDAIKNTGFSPRDLPIIPQGISRFFTSKPETSAQEKTFYEKIEVFRKKGGKIVLAVGRKEERKGIDLFLRAVGEIKHLLPDEKIMFVWAGDTDPGFLSPSFHLMLQSELEILDIEDDIVWPGPLTDIETMYGLADVFLLSSRLDPLPSVVLGAASHSVPVVCFDKASGYPDLFQQEGLFEDCVVPYLDAVEMGRKAARFLQNADLADKTGKRLCGLIDKYFDMGVYVRRLLEEVESARSQIEKKDRLCRDILAAQMTSPYCRLSSPQGVHDIIADNRLGHSARYPIPGFNVQIYRDKTGAGLLEAMADGLLHGERTHIALHGKDMVALPEKTRAALHIHAFYMDIFDDICRRIVCNQRRPDLFVSTCEGKENECREVLAKYGLTAQIKTAPNRGRDLGPMLSLFAQELMSYELIGHVHTKKSLHTDELVIKKWRESLLSNLIGVDSIPMLDNCLSWLEEHENCGLLFPETPNDIGWTKNLPYAAELANKIGMVLPAREYFIFPVGTMFWARSSALKKLFDHVFSWEDYPAEPLAFDGSMLHAIERLLPFIAEDAGYSSATTYLEKWVR